MTAIEDCMKLYRKQHPDAFERADAVARIIDPAAFSEWTCSDDDIQSLFDTRTAYMRSVALSKACEILRVLGVNLACDWDDVLTQLVKETP